MKTITLEKLEASEEIIGKLWRALRESSDGLTEKELALIVHDYGFNQTLRRLTRLKWAYRQGNGTRTEPYRYFAVENEEPPPQHIGQRLSGLRRDLTRISQKAHTARYTALAGKMGAALAEIEKEILEVREQLYVRR
jgi:hypothetical protein